MQTSKRKEIYIYLLFIFSSDLKPQNWFKYYFEDSRCKIIWSPVHRPCYIELIKLAFFIVLFISLTGGFSINAIMIPWCVYDVAIALQTCSFLCRRLNNNKYSQGAVWYCLLYTLSVGFLFGTIFKICIMIPGMNFVAFLIIWRIYGWVVTGILFIGIVTTCWKCRDVVVTHQRYFACLIVGSLLTLLYHFGPLFKTSLLHLCMNIMIFMVCIVIYAEGMFIILKWLVST